MRIAEIRTASLFFLSLLNFSLYAEPSTAEHLNGLAATSTPGVVQSNDFKPVSAIADNISVFLKSTFPIPESDWKNIFVPKLPEAIQEAPKKGQAGSDDKLLTLATYLFGYLDDSRAPEDQRRTSPPWVSIPEVTEVLQKIASEIPKAQATNDQDYLSVLEGLRLAGWVMQGQWVPNEKASVDDFKTRGPEQIAAFNKAFYERMHAYDQKKKAFYATLQDAETVISASSSDSPQRLSAEQKILSYTSLEVLEQFLKQHQASTSPRTIENMSRLAKVVDAIKSRRLESPRLLANRQNARASDERNQPAEPPRSSVQSTGGPGPSKEDIERMLTENCKKCHSVIEVVGNNIKNFSLRISKAYVPGNPVITRHSFSDALRFFKTVPEMMGFINQKDQIEKWAAMQLQN